MAGNRQAASPPCGGSALCVETTPAFRPCEEREPFTTAKGVCRTGNRRALGRCKTREGLAARALPLSYSLSAGGSRTRDHVVKSEAPDLFTTVRQRGCRGTDETETTPVAQGFPEGTARSPRRDVPREDASTVRSRMPVSPRVAERLGAKYPYLHHRQSVFRGTANAAFGVLETKESASSPPEVSKISSVSHSTAAEGRETKTPPERGLGRGSIGSNFGVALSQSASARARARPIERRAGADLSV